MSEPIVVDGMILPTMTDDELEALAKGIVAQLTRARLPAVGVPPVPPPQLHLRRRAAAPPALSDS